MGGSIIATDVYLEQGSKRTFAGAMAWPGWCRVGRDDAGALAALVEYGPRYASVVRGLEPSFAPPASVDELAVVARLRGDTTTDFGAPAVAAPGDELPVGRSELARLVAILEACWAALDRVAASAAGVELRRGPRGGGRDLRAILAHVREAEGAYLSRLGRRAPEEVADPGILRATVLDGLAQVAPLGVPTPGPRGGTRWPARYFVRRAAWHVLDHAWEIEDRAASGAG